LSSRHQQNLQRPALKPGLLRHLAAVIYDLLLLVAVLFVATALILPLNGGAAFSAQQIIYPIYLLVISFLFYGWFWTHGGQTLGLRAWHMKVRTVNQTNMSWKQAVLRFIAAIVSWLVFGLGFLWVLVDKDHRSWHDHLSGTALFFDDSKNE
jgi:uncharacterized RDD family membrane protein YckC